MIFSRYVCIPLTEVWSTPTPGLAATQSGRDEPAWEPQELPLSPLPSWIWGYLVLLSTKLFPPLTLPHGQDEARRGTGRGEVGKADPVSLPFPEPPASTQTCWPYSEIWACPGGLRDLNPYPSSGHLDIWRIWTNSSSLAPSLPSEDRERRPTTAQKLPISWIPLNLPSPPLSCHPGLSLPL